MEKKCIEILRLDVDELLKELNKALADEWLAYYQYWIGAQVVVGPLRGAAAGEFNEHADEELKHANMLVERIIQLNGTPLLDPKEFSSETNCGYLKPTDFKVKAILEQNIKSEQCAIEHYNKLLVMTKDKDVVTYNMLLSILEDEIEHESDLMALLDDMAAV